MLLLRYIEFVMTNKKNWNILREVLWSDHCWYGPFQWCPLLFCPLRTHTHTHTHLLSQVRSRCVRRSRVTCRWWTRMCWLMRWPSSWVTRRRSSVSRDSSPSCSSWRPPPPSSAVGTGWVLASVNQTPWGGCTFQPLYSSCNINGLLM